MTRDVRSWTLPKADHRTDPLRGALGVSLEEQSRFLVNSISTAAALIGLARRGRFRGLGPYVARPETNVATIHRLGSGHSKAWLSYPLSAGRLG